MSIPNLEMGITLQKAIAAANEKWIELMLVAAQEDDPCAAAVLGISQEALLEYKGISRANLESSARYGAPLFVPRINDAATLRQAFATGFSSPHAIAAITKTLPLSLLDSSAK